jgi:hypothetical protein
MGARASQATGADIPRPRPAPLAPAAPSVAAVPAEVPAHLSPEAVAGLLRKVERSGLDSLSENELALLRQSTDMPATPLDSPDITIAAPTADDINLSSSATDLGAGLPPPAPTSNLRRKKAAAPSDLEKLANEIVQYTGTSSTEPVSPQAVRKIQARIDALPSEDVAALVAKLGNEEDAMRRLERVQNLSADATRDPLHHAAASIDAAEQARAGTMRPQGAMTPEFVAEYVPPQAMPSSYDEALAAERDRLADLDRRSAGGGLSKEELSSLAGEDGVRRLPLFVRGRPDRPTHYETRSVGGRAVESRDIKLLKDVNDAHDQIAAATTPEEQAAALAKLQAAESALERKYPNGRKAMPDSRLNRGGQQETYDNLVVSLVGGRPRAAQNLNRSSDTLSAAERAAQHDEAIRAFGDDAWEMLPDSGELDDVSSLGESGKPKKVRGRPLPSRQMGALDQLTGGQNPLAMTNADGSLVFPDSRAAAQQILAGNSVFKPGTAWYDMAVEQIARAIDARHGGDALEGAADLSPAVPGEGMAVHTTQDPANIPREGVRDMRGLGRGIPNQRSVSPTAAPEGDLPPLQPGRKQPEPPASVDEQQLEASAVNIPPVEGDVDGLAPTAPAPSKGKGGRKGGKGEPSAKGESLPPVEGDWDALPDAEKNKAFEDFAATYGEPPAPDNAQFVEDARKHWESKNKPAAAAKAKPTPAAGGAGGSGKKPPPPDAPDKLPPVEGDDAAKADASKPKKDASPDAEKPKSDTSKPAAPETPEKKRFWDRYRVAGAGLLATGVVNLLARLGRQADGNGPSPADDPASQPPGSSRRPVPPGGPVGDVLGGPNADISATDLDRAIDRLRTARSGTGARTQVLQNW